MNETFNLTEILYPTDANYAIRLTGERAKVSKNGTPGIGYSSYRPSGTKTAAKYSSAAYVLDKIIIDKSITAVEGLLNGTKDIIGEIISGGSSKKFMFEAPLNGKPKITTDSDFNEFELIVPLVLLAISSVNDTPQTKELREIFSRIVKSYETKGVAEEKDILMFCDSFYFGFVKGMKDDEIASCINASTFSKTIAEENANVFAILYNKKTIELMEYVFEIEGTPLPYFLEGVEIRNRKTKKKQSISGNLLESCLNGERIIPYEWSEEQKRRIPSLSTLNDYVPSKVFPSILRQIETVTSRVLERLDSGLEGVAAIRNDYLNFSLIGKPGTGKTTEMYALGAALGLPVYSIPITKNTEEDTFQGMTKVIDGGFKFVPTDFLDAFKHGGIVILEEFNLADPAVIMGALGQAIEAPFMLLEDGHKPIYRHPMCIIVGTMNIGTYGAKGVSQAFSSRLKQTYTMNDPKEEDFIAILEKKGFPNKDCKLVYDRYKTIIDHLCSNEISREEICLNVTLRSCIGALECMSMGDTLNQAIYNSLIGKIAEVDLKLAEDMYANIKNLSTK